MSATAEKTPFRTKVERGIYKRQTRDGKTTRYEVAYVDSHDKQRWETCATLKAAQRRRHQLNAKPKDERHAQDRSLFAAAAETWFEQKSRKLRPRTAAYYRSGLDLVLLPRFGRYRLAAIDADAIARLTRDLEREGLHAVDPKRPVRPLGRSSIENYLKPLQGTLAYSARRGWIVASPFSILTSDDRPSDGDEEERPPAHEWTAEELAALFAASQRVAEREKSRHDYSTLLLVTATLGLRLGEVLGLRWEDFNKKTDVLTVARQWLRATKVGDVRLPARYGPPKTKAGARVLAVPSDLRDELVTFRQRRAASSGLRSVAKDRPIFASRQGTPLAHRNVTRRGFETARDLAGLPESLTFHDLRHAAASRLIASGVDDAMVADQIGHGDSAVTRKVYAHVYDRETKMDAVRVALAGAVPTATVDARVRGER